MRRSLFVAIPAAAALVGCAALALRPKPGPSWRLAAVERGDVVRRVTATGTVNALVQVSVGTQVSGSVTELKADFNSIVRKGQVIARIDPTVNETQVADARAALRKAQASADLAREERDRYRRMAAQQLVSTADLRTRETAFETAQGDLEAAKAALSRARINLGYCTISAPVDGVVVSRVVDVGQTVAASFSTPSLFVIAKDLSRMKVQASIDESDIGQVRPGQQATFTVDSYPGMTFKGAVSEVQLNPTVTNNVVTYTVVMEVDNVPRPAGTAPAARVQGSSRYREAGSRVYQGEMALFPGMTANVAILTTERKGVLRVPNAALRFTPAGQVPVKGDRVWVLENGAPRAVPVALGAAGQQFTEVSGEGIREGLRVLTGSDQAPQAAPAQQKATLGGPPGPPR
ncbi:MAG TPA: efflux RND transporter periplasmic adaptor subunit [Holophaga sp.]|nr:efflux RND transporter periplasmic adaptor subunit [Holophaga sp.]